MRTAAPLLLFSALAVAQGAPQSVDGKALFEKKCSVCHASETDERRIGPSLKSVKNGTLPDAIGKPATHDNILQKINNGGGGMPVFRDLLTSEEKEAIIKYVLTL